jgi:hypothetical protein
MLVATQPASAAAAVGLGTADRFAVLAGATVTNTGVTTVSGDLGVSPGTAVTGFGPGLVVNGSIHAGDSVAAGAQSDATTAYQDAQSRPSSAAAPPDLGGLVLVPGVYTGTTLNLTGRLVLDGRNDPGAVFVFQSASSLITAPGASVSLVNGASPCNVFWQVGSSATLDTGTDFAGTVLAKASITAAANVSVAGRLLARTGQVSLDSDRIILPACAAGGTVPSATGTASASGSPTITAPAPTDTASGGVTAVTGTATTPASPGESTPPAAGTTTAPGTGPTSTTGSSGTGSDTATGPLAGAAGPTGSASGQLTAGPAPQGSTADAATAALQGGAPADTGDQSAASFMFLGVPAASGAALAATGDPTAPLIGAASALMILGVACLGAGSRRRSRRTL